MKKLYCDLDGVLADFDRGVYDVLGTGPQGVPAFILWPKLARTPDFYNTLEWMPGGKELWEYIKPMSPTILTGLPVGGWAEPQKRTWCARELGIPVEVITGWSRDKHKFSAEGHVLIDDRDKLREAWEREGGTFILHKLTETTIRTLELMNLGKNS